jgi:hypothetical protein
VAEEGTIRFAEACVTTSFLINLYFESRMHCDERRVVGGVDRIGCWFGLTRVAKAHEYTGVVIARPERVR